MSDYFQAIILLDPGCPIVKFLELFIQAFLKLWADKLEYQDFNLPARLAKAW